ncbi:MAG: NADH-quinone oxidoreductase subunit NuoG [Devosiaceae bacterium]|nr:NADH-quinone oxidoreductase subunit NuoG [Devosiaceae bacterium MH13]
MSDTRTIIVDGTEVDVPAHYTLLQACEEAGAEIPRFCYHERLSVAGNCRMCLVELKGAPKPIASCAWGVRDCRPGPNGEAPEVFTRTPKVKKAREGVMEFLLINHPLDCPICDQGGECDLQDQAMAYGVDKNRFEENKRAVEDKDIGALVKTIMTRCIHCTRCVRFTTEVAGVSDLGATGRGEDMEITTYLEAAMQSEMQGNVIDLCPVGALTSKPYEFKARPWELTKVESIDVMDAAGSAIRVDVKGREVMRVMPRLNEEINEEWISDKTRFIWDGLRTQRLDRPYIREGGRLRPASWGEAFAVIADKIKATPANKVGALAGDLAGAEEMFALQQLMGSLGSANLDCRVDGTALHPENGRASYLFNTTIDGIENADAVLLIGTNPRTEAPVINARFRKRWRAEPTTIGLVGPQVDLTYDYTPVGDSVADIAKLIDHGPTKAERPMVVIGQGALTGDKGAEVLALAAKLADALGMVKEGWNGFNVLHTAASRVAGLDLGFVPVEGGMDAGAMAAGGVDVLFNLGADELVVDDGPFVVYIGTHGDRGAHRADVILPAAAYTEKSATYVNTEGRPQQTQRGAFPPGEAREDWAILRALSERLGHTLPFNSLEQLRSAMYEAVPHLAALETIEPADPSVLADLAAKAPKAASSDKLSYAIEDFYLTNPIARASKVMAECSQTLNQAPMAQAAE